MVNSTKLPGTWIEESRGGTKLGTREWRGLELENQTWKEIIIRLLQKFYDRILRNNRLSGEIMLDEESGITIKLKNQNYDIEISLTEEQHQRDNEGWKSVFNIVAIDKKTKSTEKNTSIALKDNVIVHLIRELHKIDVEKDMATIISDNTVSLEKYLQSRIDIFTSQIINTCKGNNTPYKMNQEWLDSQYKIIHDDLTARFTNTISDDNKAAIPKLMCSISKGICQKASNGQYPKHTDIRNAAKERFHERVIEATWKERESREQGAMPSYKQDMINAFLESASPESKIREQYKQDPTLQKPYNPPSEEIERTALPS
jgi:hypothetical protein